MIQSSDPDWVLPGQELETEVSGRDRLHLWIMLVVVAVILGTCCGAGIALGVALS